MEPTIIDITNNSIFSEKIHELYESITTVNEGMTSTLEVLNNVNNTLLEYIEAFNEVKIFFAVLFCLMLLVVIAGLVKNV